MKRKTVLRWVTGAACASALLVLAGCYERVVRAEGLGSQGVAVQKPYRSETGLDRAFDGKSSDSGSAFDSSVRPPTAPNAPR